MVINYTLSEYCEKYSEAIKTFGMKESDFIQEYYDNICENIKSGNRITKRVYENIPELHFWINKHFLIHGINVIV